jgi:hypothetical protein
MSAACTTLPSAFDSHRPGIADEDYDAQIAECEAKLAVLKKKRDEKKK